MVQLKNRTTGQIIEVNEFDVHWYNGHEDYENAETAKTIKTDPWEAPKKETLHEGVKNGSLETSKTDESNDGNPHENGEDGQKQDGKGNETKADEGNEEKRQVLKLRRPGRPAKKHLIGHIN